MTPFPSFYDPRHIGTQFYPDMAAIARAASEANLPPASLDDANVHLLLVDMQVDFCHEQGSLYVPGALGDLRRTIEFIYGNAAAISQITCSLDSHLPNQIFSPSWWADADGRHPAPFTVITAGDVERGRWQPLTEPQWSRTYVVELERQAKKQLTIWPYHTLIGSIGHTLDAELWSAVYWHSLARRVAPHWLIKGSEPRTEHYSIVQPEIHVPGSAQGGKNQAILDTLAATDRVVIAGEAASHCVLETVEDLVLEFSDQPGKLETVFILQDCTSPVVHPQIDFGAIAQQRFAEFAQQGVQVVNSTDALPL